MARGTGASNGMTACRVGTRGIAIEADVSPAALDVASAAADEIEADWLAGRDEPDDERPILVQMTDYGTRCEWRGGSRVIAINTTIECEEDAFDVDDPTEDHVQAAMRRYLDRAIAAGSGARLDPADFV